MKNAFIVKLVGDYRMDVWLVFAETEKEARTKIHGKAKQSREDVVEVVMNVQAAFKGEELIHIAYYWE